MMQAGGGRLNAILHDAVLKVFDIVTPREQRSQISAADLEYRVRNLEAVIDPGAAVAYLTADDGFYAKRLIAAVGEGMREIMADDKVAVDDAAAVMKMVKAVVGNVNALHSKRDAIVQIGTHTLVPLIEAIVCLVASMVLTQAQYAAIKSVLTMSFALLDTFVRPLLAGRTGGMRCCGKTAAADVRTHA